MRSRTTILLPAGQGVNPKTLSLTSKSLVVETLGAQVEERATWSLEELPEPIRALLDQSHELHIRWTREESFKHASPLLSTLPSGLHIFFTPRHADQDIDLCSAIHDVFDPLAKCESVASSFSRPPILSERFAHAASFQYYQSLPSLQYLTTYVEREICQTAGDTAHHQACIEYKEVLEHAVSVDFDYDAISHAVTLTIQLTQTSTGEAASHIEIRQADPSDRIEVGVLASEIPEEPEELKLGGFLTVLGEDQKPSATLFSFPSRHHSLPAGDSTTYSASFLQPTGLHPTLAITLPRQHLRPPQRTCRLHTYLTLPSSLFVDRYQLSDADLLSSSNLVALHALSGAEDLEAPEWAIAQWGSASLFEIATPTGIANSTRDDQSLRVQIPLHLRYLEALPDGKSSYRDLATPWPIVFWACEAEEGLKMATNPFDRVNLGYDGLFGPKTMFYHVSPAQSHQLTLHLSVPVLRPQNNSWVQSLTFATVAFGVIWVLFTLFAPMRSKSSKHSKPE